ncbi:MAG: hypothetical protein V3U29_10340 [Phycisphaeraceae bacterium]
MRGSFFADDNPLAARGPRPDARFHAWQNNFVTYVNGHLPDWGLAASEAGGNTAHYTLRWVSTCCETGTWGELVNATVVK